MDDYLKASCKDMACCDTNTASTRSREFPIGPLETVTTRESRGALELVDACTKPEHVSKWFAPFTCEVTECSIDLRVGGNYHIVFVTEDGSEVVVEPAEPTRPSSRRLTGESRTAWLASKGDERDALAVEVSGDRQETDGLRDRRLTDGESLDDAAARRRPRPHDQVRSSTEDI